MNPDENKEQKSREIESNDDSDILRLGVRDKAIQVDLIWGPSIVFAKDNDESIKKSSLIRPAIKHSDKKRRLSVRKVAFQLSHDETGLSSDEDAVSDDTFQRGLLKGDRHMTDAALLNQIKHALQVIVQHTMTFLIPMIVYQIFILE